MKSSVLKKELVSKALSREKNKIYSLSVFSQKQGRIRWKGLGRKDSMERTRSRTESDLEQNRTREEERKNKLISSFNPIQSISIQKISQQKKGYFIKTYSLKYVSLQHLPLFQNMFHISLTC